MSTDYFRLDTAATVPQPSSKIGGWLPQLFVFLIAIILVMSRRPDAILHPQFFAEDGMFWYADAYNLGWLHALFISHTGYFQTLPRLSAALSLLVPLRHAPLVLNLVAIVIQVLPVTLLLSARLSSWGTLSMRIFLAFAYIALPNSGELNAAITEAQWHMALLAVLVVLSVPSHRLTWRIFDVIVILLCGLTGPFCLAMLPVACAVWWMRRRLWNVVLAVLLAACAAVQLHALLTTAAATRSQETLGATPSLFFRMLTGDVYLGALIGENHHAVNGPLAVLILVGLLGSALVIYCFLRAGLEWKLFLLYSFALYLASLHNPMISTDKPQWPVLEGAPNLRYWFFPMLAFAWSMIWCAAQHFSRPIQLIAAAAAVTMLYGVTRDWEYVPFSNHNFPEYAKRFAALPAGRAMVFPLYPEGWTMQLVKQGASSCKVFPTGFLDEPKDRAQVSGTLSVAGWVNAPEPVESVSILVDGTPTLSLKPNMARPDVDRKFPGGVVKNKGWQASLDLSKLPPGMHTIEADGQLPNGCSGLLGTAAVDIPRR